MADLYEKSISRWEGEGGFPAPEDDEILDESAQCCRWGDRGIWLKALALTGAVALLIYALAPRGSASR
ncbi:MAG: hypothetical protein KJZ70_03445 [Bryobacterales bacterium]|nr:hypothetical protein [Bryobacterales bacterium]